MKFLKPLALAAILLFTAVACSESDSEVTEPESTTTEETTTTSPEEKSDLEREAFIMGMMGEGVTEEQGECIYDTLSTEMPNFVDKFGDDMYEPTPEEEAVMLEAFSDCDALSSLLGEGTETEGATPSDPSEANGSLPPEAREVAVQEVMSSTGLSEEQAGCLVDEMVAEFGVETVISFGQDSFTPTPEQEQKLVEIVVSCDSLEASIAAGS